MTCRDKVVVVTGAAAGIGRATCDLLAAAGATVFVHDINEADAQSAAAELRDQGMRAHALVGDVSNEDDVTRNVDEVLAEVGRIDVLINNAGIGTVAPAVEYTAWRRILSVNLDGQFYWARAVASKSMIPNKSGAIINVSSVAGLAGIPEDVGYVASKHGVIGLTKALAVEWAKYGIRVNCICPGSTQTPLFQSLAAKAPERFAQRILRIPLGRVAHPVEQARAIAFLASDDASYITGAVLNNDGGQMALFSGMTSG